MAYEITDHALLRYLERVEGIDVEGYRKEILEECAPALALGATMIRSTVCTYIFRNGRLTTVLDNSMKRVKRRPRRFGWPSHLRRAMDED